VAVTTWGFRRELHGDDDEDGRSRSEKARDHAKELRRAIDEAKLPDREGRTNPDRLRMREDLVGSGLNGCDAGSRLIIALPHR